MRVLALSVLLAGLAGCTLVPAKAPDGPGTCATACSNVHAIGDCGIAPETCVHDCEAESGAETEIGVQFPVGCLTAAKTCEEATRCK